MVKGLTIALACLAVLVMPAAAQADRPFQSRFTTNTQGNIAFAANGVLTCVGAEPGCIEARTGAGTRLNNNDRVMTYIDVDSDDSTFNSSEADLTLAPGARVLFAGLYWGGRSSAGTGGLAAPNPGQRNRVLFQAPGAAGYSPLTASTIRGFDESGSQQFQGFADVTDEVSNAGPGAYRVANVQVGTGRNASQAHGWALIVAYGDPAAPPRNLTVYDGFVNVGSGSTGVTIPLSGFQTPLSGTVTSTVGIVAQEGDLATPGDGATIAGRNPLPTPLSNALNPTNNLFNSTTSRAGTYATDSVPSDNNNFGFDTDTFTTSNVLANGQSSTTVRLTTSGDAYNPGAVFIATDLYAPRIRATKVVDQAEADLGDVLTYTARFDNVLGEDDAAGFVVTDPIPAGTSFVPGSLAIDGVGQSDTPANDQAEFDAANNRVVARLGAGATGTAGGTLGIGEASEVSFQVRINDAGFAPGDQVVNVASADFRAATTGVNYDPVASAPAVTRLLLPDVTMLKTHGPDYVSGGTADILFGVFNFGEGPTTGETVITDTLPPALSVNGPIPPAGPWTCDQNGQTITCRNPDPLPPITVNDPVPVIFVPVTVAPGTPPGTLVNSATVTNASDSTPDNNTSTDEGAVAEAQFDLSVDKRVTSTPPSDPVTGELPGYPSGVPITYEITVRNDGILPAPNVQLSDTLPAPLDFQSATASQGTCTGTDCALGTINPGEAVTVQLTVAFSGDEGRYPSAEEVVNTASVTADGNDIDPSNNSDTASVQSLPIIALSITKAFAPARPAAGGPVTYTMQLRNDGPGVADVSFADLVPEDVQNPELEITGGTGECLPDLVNIAPPGVPPFLVSFCTIPRFEVGGTRTVTVRGTLKPDSAGRTVTNLAAVSGTGGEVDQTNNLAEVSFVPGTVDVGIEKTRTSPNPVAVGAEAVFDLRVYNVGDVPATDVVARDTLPAGLTPVSPPAGCEIQAQDAVCRIASLPEGEERIFEIRARAEAAAGGQTLTNRATVDVAAADPDPADNESSADVTVSPVPVPSKPSVDVAVTVQPPSGPYTVGQSGVWRLEVVNNGPSPATGVVLDATRRGARAESLGVRIAQAGCQTAAAVRCELGGLAPGERRTVEWRLRPRQAERLTVAAEVSAVETDTVPPNDTDDAAIRPRLAIAGVTLDTGKRRLEPGEVTDLLVRARTRGRRPALGARICIRVPEGLAIVRRGGATLRGGKACWSVRRLAGGSSRRFALRLRAVPGNRARTVTIPATISGPNLRTRRTRVTIELLPAQSRGGGVTG